MKSGLLISFLALSTLSSFAQGTINFNNRAVGSVVTRVYEGGTAMRVGNGTDDTPSGTMDWTSFTPLTGSNWMVSIRAAVGANQPESSLTFGINPTTTTFRMGRNAGGFAGGSDGFVIATLSEIPFDTPVATIEVFAWDRVAGGNDPATAFALWKGSAIEGGVSGAFNLNDLGGAINIPPNLVGLQSFNVWLIPEPGTLAFLGLSTALLVRRTLHSKSRNR
jgi:hypothetical protein